MPFSELGTALNMVVAHGRFISLFLKNQNIPLLHTQVTIMIFRTALTGLRSELSILHKDRVLLLAYLMDEESEAQIGETFCLRLSSKPLAELGKDIG